MTNVSVPGKITGLVCADDLSISTPIAGGPFGSPTMLSPSGALIDLILIDISSNQYFELDAAFPVGAIVELYYDPNGPSGGSQMNVMDENSNDVSPQNSYTRGRGYRLTKIGSALARNWVRTA